MQQECSVCETEKPISSFIKNRKICKECNNDTRRHKYETNEDHRKKLIKLSSDFKHKKAIQQKQLNEEEIGKGNKKCNYCDMITEKNNFRHNRLKCKDCERDEPIDKLKRSVRSRISSAISNKNKHTIEYLGCNSTEYLKWLLTNDYGFTLENRGYIWHIDHVIPLSRFNLENECEQLIAFNWRNTTPLYSKENLSKNNKIIRSQVEQHYKKLVEYHLENELDLPQVFIDLFARYLVAGNPLELLLPLTDGNIREELG